MKHSPRVAFFADSFHEANGVANTCRQIEAYARRHEAAFLMVCAGDSKSLVKHGKSSRLELPKSAAAWRVEHDLSFDPLFLRHRRDALNAVAEFEPDLVHLTGPGDVSLLGIFCARTLRVPMTASWHTELHDYAQTRACKHLRFLPEGAMRPIGGWINRGSLAGLAQFYKLGRVLFAPNPEAVQMLGERTGRRVVLMTRGVDPEAFSPKHRRRTDSVLRVGYVGRLSPEKSVHLLIGVEQALKDAGVGEFTIHIVGDGRERDWLRARMVNATFSGILRGEDLARAYADFDLFVFPSRTDAFGNVVLETLASGVPAVVMAAGGPPTIVDHRETGVVAHTDEEFFRAVVDLALDPDLRRLMGLRAREAALRRSWDVVGDTVFEAYRQALDQEKITDQTPSKEHSPTPAVT